MEDFDIDNLLGQIDAPPEIVLSTLEQVKTESETDWKTLFEAYLSLPTSVAYTFAVLSNDQRAVALGSGWKKFYETYKLKDKPPALDSIDPTFKSRHKRGWNAGLYARTIVDVNRWLAFTGNCEFVPGITEDGEIMYWCNKANYGSLPLLPGDPYIFHNFTPLFSKGKDGLRIRDYPPNFVNAVLTATGQRWRGPAISSHILKLALNGCKEPHQVSSYANEANAVKFMKSLSDFDPASARKIVTERNSVFTNRIPQWNELFSLVGHDVCGSVSVDRILASLYDGKGFYGSISNVVYWLSTSSVLKCQNVPDTIIQHTKLNFYANDSWPKDCIMYAVTPVDIANYATFMKAPPRAVIIPLTSATKGGKHVDALINTAAHTRLIVAFSDTPVVILDTHVPEGVKGFNTNSLKSNLNALEKEILVKMLEVLKQQLDNGADVPLIWEAVPANEYGVNRCAITWVAITLPIVRVRYTHMSMDDVEKESLAPTSHASEIIVDGKKVSHGDPSLVASNYPKALPTFVSTHPYVLQTGMWYSANGAVLGREYRPDLYSNTLAASAIVPVNVPKYYVAKKRFDGANLVTESSDVISPDSNGEKDMIIFQLKISIVKHENAIATLLYDNFVKNTKVDKDCANTNAVILANIKTDTGLLETAQKNADEAATKIISDRIKLNEGTIKSNENVAVERIDKNNKDAEKKRKEIKALIKAANTEINDLEAPETASEDEEDMAN